MHQRGIFLPAPSKRPTDRTETRSGRKPRQGPLIGHRRRFASRSGSTAHTRKSHRQQPLQGICAHSPLGLSRTLYHHFLLLSSSLSLSTLYVCSWIDVHQCTHTWRDRATLLCLQGRVVTAVPVAASGICTRRLSLCGHSSSSASAPVSRTRPGKPMHALGQLYLPLPDRLKKYIPRVF